MTILEQNQIISLLIKTGYYRYIIKYIGKFDKSSIRKIIKKIALLPSGWIYIFEFINNFDNEDKEFITSIAIKETRSYQSLIHSGIRVQEKEKNKILKYFIKKRKWDILLNNFNYFNLSMSRIFFLIKERPHLYNDFIIEKLLDNFEKLSSKEQKSLLHWLVQEKKVGIISKVYDKIKLTIDGSYLKHLLIKLNRINDIFKFHHLFEGIDWNELIQTSGKKPRSLGELAEYINEISGIDNSTALNALILGGYFPQIKRNIDKFNCDKDILLSSLVKRQNEIKKALYILGAEADSIEALN